MQLKDKNVTRLFAYSSEYRNMILCIGYGVVYNTKPNPPNNGPIRKECKLLQYIVSLATEAEIAGLFHNCQKIVEIKQILIALGHL